MRCDQMASTGTQAPQSLADCWGAARYTSFEAGSRPRGWQARDAGPTRPSYGPATAGSPHAGPERGPTDTDLRRCAWDDRGGHRPRQVRPQADGVAKSAPQAIAAGQN